MLKRFISLMLCFALVVCCWAPAFGATTATTTSQASSVQIEETSDTDEDQANEDTTSSSDTVDEESDGNSDEDTVSEEDAAAAEAAAKAAEEAAAAAKAAEEKAAAEAAAAKKKATLYRNGLAAYIRSVNPNLSKSWSKTLAQYFIDIGDKYSLDPLVLMALAQYESTFRSKVTSAAGYKGIMQTSDSLAKKYGYKPSSLYKAKVSITVGARYLSTLKKTFGNYTKSLSAYIYGSSAVSKGSYSKKAAYKILKTRTAIKTYLSNNNYV